MSAPNGSDRIDIVPDVSAGLLKVERNRSRLGPTLRRLFDTDGYLRGAIPEEAVARSRKSRSEALRISQEVDPWLRARRRAEERRLLRREYQRKVRAGRFPQHETKIPLYAYQHEGMLHLAFNERALLADEMGLGKTVQAIAACAVLHRLGKLDRVLIVSPASLKTEWEEQIQKFTDLPYQVVFGLHHKRLAAYGNAPFFTIVNFIDPAALGSLFRFNREFYDLDEKGRPEGYWNLDRLRRRIRPYMIRRRKVDVETELPSRSDRDHETNVARILSAARRRPLTKREQDKLMRELAMMRMVCDTPYILDPENRTCPKLKELESVLDELRSDPDVKIVIFSEWVRMLELVYELTEEEQQKTADLRKQAGRKLKMARVLSLEQLDEEAREALLGALPLLGQALAVEHRLPEPRDAHEALHGPAAPLWGKALDRLREFFEQPEAPVLATIQALEGAGLN